MKNVFAVNVSDEENTEIDGTPLIDRRVSEETAKKWRELYDRSVFPHRTHISTLIAIFCAFQSLMVINLLNKREQIGLILAVASFGLVSAIVGAILAHRHKQKWRQERDTARAEWEKECQLLQRETTEELRVPSDAAKIDVLEYTYKDPAKPEWTDILEMSIFLEGSRFCLAGEGFRISLGLSGIRRFRRCEDAITCCAWNKNTPPGEGIYADVQYDDKTNFDYKIPGYAVLEFTEGDEDYEISIPCYDVPAVEALIGMKAED